MNDPHVVTLRYRLEPGKSVTFDNPAPVTWETDLFGAQLEADQLTVSPKDHYASSDAARAAVDGYIRGWEFESDLRWGRGEIRFVYEDAEVIDRNPPAAGTAIAGKAHLVLDSITLTATATVHITRINYPPPPTPALRLMPDVETLQYRYFGYLDGKEPLPAMAYFCLSYLEHYLTQSRQEAAKKYQIHLEVLKKLGELCSNRWDPQIARKAGTKGNSSGLIPYQPDELRWLEAAIKEIIYRVAEHCSNPEQRLTQITLKDLPPL